MDDETRTKILALLDEHRIMTIATLRPDGWPQATTVGYVNEGLKIFFLCAPNSQKARNLAGDSRVSITVDHDTSDLFAISGLSMAAHARPVTNRAEAERIIARCRNNIPLVRRRNSPCRRPTRSRSSR